MRAAASPGRDDDIGAATGPTARHAQRILDDIIESSKGGPSCPSQVTPGQPGVESRSSRGGRLSHTPAAVENGPGSTEVVPIWTLDLRRAHGENGCRCQRSVFDGASVRHD